MTALLEGGSGALQSTFPFKAGPLPVLAQVSLVLPSKVLKNLEVESPLPLWAASLPREEVFH